MSIYTLLAQKSDAEHLVYSIKRDNGWYKDDIFVLVVYSYNNGYNLKLRIPKMTKDYGIAFVAEWLSKFMLFSYRTDVCSSHEVKLDIELKK